MKATVDRAVAVANCRRDILRDIASLRTEKSALLLFRGGAPFELDQAERTGSGRGDKNEAGGLSQRAVFGFRPLDAARSPQHVEIAHGARTVFGVHRGKLRYDPFDYDQLAARWKPQLVLLDIGLPDMSGYEVAQRLRSLYSKAECTIVAVSGYGQDADVTGAKRSGVDRHVMKPLDEQVLGAIVAEVTDKPARHGSERA